MAIEDVIYNADGTTHSYRINGNVRLATHLSATEKQERLARIECETRAGENINQDWMDMVKSFDDEVLSYAHPAINVRTQKFNRLNFFSDIFYLYVTFAILILVAGVWLVF